MDSFQSRTCPDGDFFWIISLYLHSPYMARQRRKHLDTCGEKHTETYVSGSSLPRPRKRSLGFPRPENVFGATFYKGFYKAFGTRPFSRILAYLGQVSPDVSRLIIFLRNTASALNEAYLKGVVKQNASNQIQPQMKTFSKDL